MTQIEKRLRMQTACTSLVLGVGLTVLSVSACAELAWGKPAYIVVGKDAPQEEAFAAREFQRLYALRSGDTLPIVNEIGGENGVYVGRAALNLEDTIQTVRPDGTRVTIGTHGSLKSGLERLLGIDIDGLPKDDFVYSITGWVGRFDIYIAGTTPHATLEAVYDFCEKNLDTRRDANEKELSHLAPFSGWSLNNFIQQPDIEIQRLKRELKLQLPAVDATTPNDSQHSKTNDQN